MDTNKPILVTGAAGSIGAVGNVVTTKLLERGHKVRAMVHRDDERAQNLRDKGAEVVVGDLLNLHDMHRIIEGCGSLYFGMSVSDSYLAATVNVAAVAKHHGIETFVNMSQMTLSQMSITETTDSPQHKLHWLAEQALNWSGLPIVHVRPTVFMDGFFLKFSTQTIKGRDALILPFGDGKTSPIAASDVGLAVAEILSNPTPHIGSIYHLTGPECEDMSYYAKQFTAVLGRPISYIDVPVAAWREAVKGAGLSSHVIDHLSTMGNLHRAGRYARMSDDFFKLTGTQPIDARTFISRHAASFEK
ncbi:NAD(P)H-binding protein [Pseudomonas sp. NPDC088368]|uniref:NmrA family NAD(P)-binding protein n=1 Tax=Pseudomonas sp. NPDC088368 TaxID=3364453 RepID=UPI0038257D4A